MCGFSRQIAVDYATAGIRVNTVSPGPVVTDLAATSVANEPDFPPLGPAGAPDIAADASPAAAAAAELPPAFDPSPRLFTNSLPMDVAYPILWLSSDEAAAITGTDLMVDGGFSIKGMASVAEGDDPAKAHTMSEPR
jgi:NAD(P)-dependent dehydrogenase (short-subunit alcohol dehydrogenase family)